jgi:hypothetical protein
MVVITGRFFFKIFNRYTVLTVDIPEDYNYNGFFSSSRRDLPIHDFYSFFGGVLIMYFFSIPLQFAYSMLYPKILVRRQSIHRHPRAGRGIGGLVGVASTPDVNIASWTYRMMTWWRIRGKYQCILCLRGLYITIFIFILTPLSFGLVFDIYVLSPLRNQNVNLLNQLGDYYYFYINRLGHWVDITYIHFKISKMRLQCLIIVA